MAFKGWKISPHQVGTGSYSHLLDVSFLDPKGHTGKGKKAIFLLSLEREIREWVLPWARWDKIAKPKALGGWGLKTIFLFSKALAEKSVWRLITTNILWTTVVLRKYLAPLTLTEWIRSPSLRTTRIFVMWKSVLQAFAVIGNRLAWMVGSGKSLRIVQDPWVGSKREHILPVDLYTELDHGGY